MTKPMTAQEFSALAIALFGTSYGWQSALARLLNVSDRTVRRWAASGPPPRIRAELLKMAGIEDESQLAFPRDEWIIGEGAKVGSVRPEYIIHARSPRFIARVVEIDELTEEPEPDEDPVDLVTGVTYQASPTSLLCEFQWIDRPPGPANLLKLLEAAADALSV